jgi:hypothetical protein
MQKFDLASISSSPSVVVIIGKRATGKSVLALDVLHDVGIKKGVVFAPTEKQLYDAVFVEDDVDVRCDYSPEVIQAFVERQRLSSSDLAFAVFDSCMMDMEWTKENPIKELFINNRNLKTTIVLTMPFAYKLPPLMHSQIEYVFVLREDAASNRKRIHDLYGGGFELNEFHQVMNQITQAQKGECLVINNVPESSRLEDQAFWYCAKPLTPVSAIKLSNGEKVDDSVSTNEPY